MAHAEVIQNGVVIVKPDPRLLRAIRTAQQFLGKVGSAVLTTGGKALPGVRSLIRHELILRWLHRQLEDFAHRQKYRGKAVYVVLDEKILSGAKDLVALVRDNAKVFLPIAQLESGIRNAFGLIAREKIHSEQKRKIKKRVQTYGEPWQHRSSTGQKKR
ncbi:MAG: hypothetical protein A3B37_00045 [Candidatus Sungbacteria bacterium RIFCSPLOWO2_01_FULL_59_16]|uniref:Uncharacterized protein n=1 Tax=Candidatus Sungbacteria bacterium RIFCSPLOWO2_01_FULL_59_16 TaxID=1802280 RepID=A0A1G2LCG9_9BACT|nr:MAG: hypothetical protein A3B37_00045 [Candidatus Sungbacteria bacterium RIFCSPLOWO2_01_FULL_59_16]